MMMDELMDMLRGVEAGHLEMNAEMAGEVVGAIEILQTRLNYYEKLKREGRLQIRRPLGKQCGTCDNFNRKGTTANGICAVRYHRRHKDQPLLVAQTRQCCLDYKPREATEETHESE